jgi:uncharacterized protein (TIGR02217 family)
MTVLAAIFPPRVSYGFRGVPGYLTGIQETTTGHENRNAKRSAPRWRFEADKELLSEADYIEARNFFLAVSGAASGFLFKNWADYKSDGEQTLGTGDGAETEFQLVYTASSPLTSKTRTITKPAAGTVTVYLDGVEVDSADYTVSTTTGVITFDVAPGNGVEVTAEFEFYYPVRFQDDELAISITHRADRFNLEGLTFIEVLGE